MLVDCRTLLALTGCCMIGVMALPHASPGMPPIPKVTPSQLKGNSNSLDGTSSHHDSGAKAGEKADAATSQTSGSTATNAQLAHSGKFFEINLEQFPVESFPRKPLDVKIPAKPGSHTKRNPANSPSSYYEIAIEDVLQQVRTFYAPVTIKGKKYQVMVDTASPDFWVWGTSLSATDRKEMIEYHPHRAFYDLGPLQPGSESKSRSSFSVHYSALGSISGEVTVEEIVISSDRTRSLRIPNQLFGCASRWVVQPGQLKWYCEPMDGVMGLGLSRIGSSMVRRPQVGPVEPIGKMGATGIVEHAFDRGEIDKAVFTIDLYRHRGGDFELEPGPKSKLVIGKCLCDSDDEKEQDVGWVPAASNLAGYWLLSGALSFSSHHSAFPSLFAFDTINPFIRIHPKDEWILKAYYDQLAQTNQILVWMTQLPGTPWSPGTLWWYCTNADPPAFTFNLAGRQVVIPGAHMIHSRGYAVPGTGLLWEICIGALQLGSHSQESMSTNLGIPFFLSNTVCFDEGRYVHGHGHTAPPRIKWCSKRAGMSPAAKSTYPPTTFWTFPPEKKKFTPGTTFP